MINYKILTEASGSLTSGFLLNAIRESGHICVASDIDARTHAYCLSDEFVLAPSKHDPQLWSKMEDILLSKNIDIVIPSFDETLEGWALRKQYFLDKGIHVILSPYETVKKCIDKWDTYQLFLSLGIPTPKTSLDYEYPLVKPRTGRGGQGITIGVEPQSMAGMISQELIKGEEYTVDCLFDREGEPVYIVPRKRIGVHNGKSTGGIVCQNEKIENYIRICSRHVRFEGPINFQCFVTPDEEIFFIEVNPRIAGGMALGFAATENWIPLLIGNFIDNLKISPKKIHDGMQMVRYYAECFIP